MSATTRVAAALALACLAAPRPAAGQMGTIIDWINKLSGPGFVRAGLAIPLVGSEASSLRLVPYYGLSWDEGDGAPEGAEQIAIFSGQLEGRTRLLTLGRAVDIDGSLGFAIHNFHGSGDFDSFWSPSFPALVALRPRFGGDRGAVWLGTGFHVFLPFPDDAFEGLGVDVSTDSIEATWTLALGIELFPDARIF